MISSIKVVRVGVLVERNGSDIIPFTYRMFHCRSRDKGSKKYVPLSEWAASEVDLLSVRSGLPGQDKILIYGTARFWVHMRMIHTIDYFGEHDSDVEILKCRRIK